MEKEHDVKLIDLKKQSGKYRYLFGTPPEKCEHRFKAYRKLVEPYGLTSDA